MAKVVHCECGTDVEAESEDELVDKVEAHVADSHPEMVGTMSREQILEMSEDQYPAGNRILSPAAEFRSGSGRLVQRPWTEVTGSSTSPRQARRVPVSWASSLAATLSLFVQSMSGAARSMVPKPYPALR